MHIGLKGNEKGLRAYDNFENATSSGSAQQFDNQATETNMLKQGFTRGTPVSPWFLPKQEFDLGKDTTFCRRIILG